MARKRFERSRRSRMRLTRFEWLSTGVRNAFASIVVLTLGLGATLAVDSASAGAASPADQGVTSTTIRVGFPVIDFAALAAVGVHLNDGNFQDAISALTASMNNHGGIDGRKIVPYVTLDNPANTTSGTANCSQLTEDDHVFIVILPVYPDCYQVTHDTPVIDGTLPGTLPASAAPDFSLTPPDTAYDPIELAALSKRGVFKDKKVGVYYGTGIDAARSTRSSNRSEEAARRCRSSSWGLCSSHRHGRGGPADTDHCAEVQE